jgi:hypothetical protein
MQAKAFLAQPAHPGQVNTARLDRFDRSVG